MADDDSPPTGALLVATPAPSDPVNAVSEESVAHCTLLWFGEADTLRPDAVDAIRDHVADVAGRFPAFPAKVSGRAILGSEDAGVLILESGELAALRADLFDHEAVQDAYLAATQFPHWVPHMTIWYGKGLPDVFEPGEITFGAVGLWLAGQHQSFSLRPAPAVGADEEEALLSAGLTIPPVLTAADLPLCVSYADAHPHARWYAQKRAVALGAAHLLPSQWVPQ